MNQYNCIVIGGGAAGFFAAVHAGEKVLLLEKSHVGLSKVKISGGGRCNVTHNCFDPKQLVQNYPRGNKELLGPFHTFNPKHTINWFLKRGVHLHVESDGRMFPTTNTSSTIIQCLLAEAKERQVEIQYKCSVLEIEKSESGFIVHTKEQKPLHTKKIILTTGSSSLGYSLAEKLGHSIEKPIASLFTFNVPTSPLLNLSGITLEDCELSLKGTPLKQRGPLLLTHFGFSGPSAIKLSAFGAPYLFEKNYKAPLLINWLPNSNLKETTNTLLQRKASHPTSTLLSSNSFHLPKNLWRSLVQESAQKLSALSNKALKELAEKLHKDEYQIDGKTTNKEEFVTCGGVRLSEVDFKTMESKLCPNLYFAGEILNIDGITGGFNFQNAWTTGFIAGTHIASIKFKQL